MMMKKLVWRLREQPSTESLRELVSSGLLTKEEAREILFSSENKEDRDKKSLESEIKFLRELVEKLANSQKVVEIIREIEKPYHPYPWWQPYWSWCNATTYSTGLTTTSGDMMMSASNINFSDIKTF